MNIVVVDDDKIVAMSLKTIIEACGSITVAEMGSSGKEAVELYEKHKPDVLLMDIRMDGMTGIEAGEIILRKDKNARILYLTTFADDEYIIKALNIGAKGYILKQDEFDYEKHSISAKEREIIELVAEGLSNKEIASELYLGEGTVRNYISAVLDKLDLRDRTQLAVFYYTKCK